MQIYPNRLNIYKFFYQEVYIYIYVYIYSTPPPQPGWNTKSIFKQGLDSEFSFSKKCFNTKFKELSLPCCLLIARRRLVVFIPFLRYSYNIKCKEHCPRFELRLPSWFLTIINITLWVLLLIKQYMKGLQIWWKPYFSEIVIAMWLVDFNDKARDTAHHWKERQRTETKETHLYFNV